MKAGRDVLLFTTAIIYLRANTRTERITEESVDQTEMILLKESREKKHYISCHLPVKKCIMDTDTFPPMMLCAFHWE